MRITACSAIIVRDDDDKIFIDLEATHALLAAIAGQAQIDLLHRAIESYRRALGHWIPEEHLLAGEFLFIAAETLSRFLLESRADAAGVTPKNIARAAGLETKAMRARILVIAG